MARFDFYKRITSVSTLCNQLLWLNTRPSAVMRVAIQSIARWTFTPTKTYAIFVQILAIFYRYSNYRNYAPPLDVKGGIITEKVFPVFSECFFWTCFGLVMYIWELMDVTERLALQM